AAGTGSAERFREQCADADIPARVHTVHDAEPGVVSVVPQLTSTGWSSVGARVLVVSETDLTGRRTAAAGPKVRVATRRRNAVDPLPLRPGGFVVHAQHGVGRCVEVAQRSVRGTVREYLVIEYAPSKKGQPADRLSVPTDQLDLVTKYTGGESPSVNK